MQGYMNYEQICRYHTSMAEISTVQKEFTKIKYILLVLLERKDLNILFKSKIKISK